MKVGKILFRVSFSVDSRVKLQRWRVSSVQRPSRRRMAWLGIAPFGPNRRPKQVYIRTGKGRQGWWGERDSFRLDDWPDRCPYAASERAAWKKVIPEIKKRIADLEGSRPEAEGDEEWLKEIRDGLRMLRSNLTLALKRVA